MEQQEIDKIVRETEEVNAQNVTDLNIEDIIPNNFDNVVVQIYEGRQYLYLTGNKTGSSIKKWLNYPGGIFATDVKHYTYNNGKDGQYVLLQMEDKRIIARLINNEEIDGFNSLGLIDGKIKDKLFMTLKKLNDSENLKSIKKYITTNKVTKQKTEESTENEEDESEEESAEDNMKLFN